MKFSVLIATRNRPQDLVPCLRSVFALDHPDFDVYVLDQSTSDASEAAVREAFGAPENLRYIRSNTVGKTVALNLLLQSATGELLALTDDDTEVPTDWLTTMERAFDSYPDMDIVFGQVLPPTVEPGQPNHVPCLMFEQGFEIERGRAFGMGANMAVSRSVAERTLQYDPVLGPGCPLAASEEFDFVYRAGLAGYRVRAEPSIKLIHRATRTAEQWDKVMYLYGVGDAGCLAKHARCGDWRLAARFLGRIVFFGARLAKRLIQRKPATERLYLRGYWHGFKNSLGYRVDKRQRLYIAS